MLIGYPKEPSGMKITNSLRGVYMTCPKKFYWRVRRKLVPIVKAPCFAFGSLWHLIREWKLNGISQEEVERRLSGRHQEIVEASEWPDRADETYGRLVALSRADRFRLAHGWKLVATEVSWEMPVTDPSGDVTNNRVWAGKIDAIYVDASGRYVLGEHKTSGQRPSSAYFERLELDQQISLYLMAMKSMGYECDRVYYDVTRKPAIKKKNSETREQYIGRLLEKITDPGEEYFTKAMVYRSEASLKEAHKDIWIQTMKLNHAMLTGQWEKNPSQCILMGKCPYFSLCTADDPEEIIANNFKTEDPNVELKEEE